MSDERPLRVALTFFGPGCWMWQSEDGEEGVAATRELAATAAARRLGLGIEVDHIDHGTSECP